MSSVVVVNYGMGNIKSVIRGLEQAGSRPLLSDNPDVIRKADRVILPGVGAFKDGMKELDRRNLGPALQDFINTGRPLLGICLGMQMLFDKSAEHGEHSGLGFIPGQVVKIPPHISDTLKRRIPHIGWSALRYPERCQNWENSVLETTDEGDFFYFVHSFMAIPDNNKHILAQCDYEGLPICAAVRKENIIGCQFHPEKSAESGLEILKKFLTVSTN